MTFLDKLDIVMDIQMMCVSLDGFASWWISLWWILNWTFPRPDSGSLFNPVSSLNPVDLIWISQFQSITSFFNVISFTQVNVTQFFVLINTLSVNGGGPNYVLRGVKKFIIHESYNIKPKVSTANHNRSICQILNSD